MGAARMGFIATVRMTSPSTGAGPLSVTMASFTALRPGVHRCRTPLGTGLSHIREQVFVFEDRFLLRRRTGRLAFRRIKPDAIYRIKLRISIAAVIVTSIQLSRLARLILTLKCLALILHSRNTLRTGTAAAAEYDRYEKYGRCD